MSYPPQMPLNYALPQSGRPRQFGRGIFGWILFGGLAVMLIFLQRQKHQAQPYVTVPISQFYDEVTAGNVAEVVIDRDEVTGKFRGPFAGEGYFRAKVPRDASSNWEFIRWVLQHHGNATVTISSNSDLVSDILLPLIPWIVIFLFIWFFVFRLLRKQNQRSAAPPGVWYPPQPGYPQPPPGYAAPAQDYDASQRPPGGNP